MKSKKPGNARRLSPSAASSPQPSENTPVEEPRSRKRKSTEGQNESRYRLSKRRKQDFRYLKPTSREISQNVVTKHWKALPEPAQEQVKGIITEAKRSVTYSSRDLNRAQEAEQALERLLRIIHQRLPRMPFPKNSKDTHFDLGKVLERNRQLESQLTPALHSVELLKAAIDDETALLDRERAALADLRETAKAREAEQKRLAKKAHPLVKDLEGSKPTSDDAESIGLVSSDFEVESPFDSRDPEIQSIVQQFTNHLGTMRGNLAQVVGVEESISETNTALTAFASSLRSR